MTTQAPVRVVAAIEEPAVQAAQVLADAFLTESFTSYLFNLATEKRRGRFRALQAASVAGKLARGQPILLALQGDQPVGIAILKAPGRASERSVRRSGLRRTLAQLPLLCGLLSQIRWRRLRWALRAIRLPPEVGRGWYTLEGLAVAPPHQGQGIGNLLLHAVRAHVERDPAAQGIYLFTADDANRAYYERRGYRVLSTAKGDGTFCVYHMALSLDRAHGTP